MLAASKALLYLSSVLLIGAGVWSLLLSQNRSMHRWIVIGVTAGAGLLVVLSLIDVVLILQGLLGYSDRDLVIDYLQNTRHGTAILWRSALSVLLATTILVSWQSPRWRRPATLVFVALSLALCASFSWTSHAAAMGGTVPLLSDLIHYAAAGLWGGAILYLALSPTWRLEEARADLQQSLERISAIGLASVMVLLLSGAMNTLVHMHDPAGFVRSEYGAALGIKLVLVSLIIAIAAVNRWHLLPQIHAARPLNRLRRLVQLEALLLVGAFVATGILSTSPLPHDSSATANVFINLGKLLEFLRNP